MTDGPSLTRAIAAAIVDVVVADPACRRVIPDVSFYNVGQQAAGGLRNAVNMLREYSAQVDYEWAQASRKASPAEVKAAKRHWEQVQAEGYSLACTNVADVTQRAISAAIGSGALSQGLTKAAQVDRFPRQDNNVVFYHSAAAVYLTSGKGYVFDWHKTLSLRNPLISRSVEEWIRGDDDFRVLFGVFQGWGEAQMEICVRGDAAETRALPGCSPLLGPCTH